ncbi:MAG: BatA domain-containing protein, partial [Gemmatimonadota bacterium]
MARALRGRGGVLRADPHRPAVRCAAAARLRPSPAPRMTFLTPWGWGLAAAVAVPLVLHLWRRRAQVRVEFPAVRYLLRMEREHAREVRVQNLLL